jgi:hypothetical protein
MYDNDIIKRQSVLDMATAYEQAVANIHQAHDLLKTADDRLKLAFSDRPGFGVLGHGSNRWDQESILQRLKADAWRAIVNQMSVRRMMSSKRAAELDKAIASGALPDITADNIFATCHGMLDSLHDYLNEAVDEVFDFLRPRQSDLKTNSEYEVGRKVILDWMIDSHWNSKPHPAHRAEQNLRNLDNVFSLLDGKGAIQSWGGPIYDAIKSMEKYGEIKETEYFRLKACKNGHLHVEFKRMDLVRKLNEIAGGNRLRNAS